MDNVSKTSDVKPLESLVIYLDDRAQKTSKEEEAVAKFETFSNGKVFYYVSVLNNKVVDILDDVLKRSKKSWVFKRVNEKCFSSYVSYLNSRRTSSLNNANRELYSGKN